MWSSILQDPADMVLSSLCLHCPFCVDVTGLLQCLNAERAIERLEALKSGNGKFRSKDLLEGVLGLQWQEITGVARPDIR